MQGVAKKRGEKISPPNNRNLIKYVRNIDNYKIIVKYK